jgi:predicted S18 family serine protease
LSIAVSEDTPGGAGPSFRAGVWMAAMVAALERSDVLSNVTIGLEIPGRIDGPSAGGAVCLAVLSALDDIEFPADCAVTGIIMPDGTIGDVGGIANKMRAAATYGAKRIMVPAYLRFETDETTGEDVDLKQLAVSLGLEFIPVENVAQAYDLLHRRGPRVPTAIHRSVLELSTATEEVLKAR